MEQEPKCPICGGKEISYSELKGMWECLCCGARVWNRALTEQEIQEQYEQVVYGYDGFPGDLIGDALRSGESS